jgi:hypothetical protein
MMFRLTLIASLIALVSLLVPPGGRVVQATQPCPANPSPPDAGDPSMILNEPAAGDTVTSPVHISGLARVFEANVRITVYSASGMVLEDTFTTAAEAGPALAPFEADVPFTVLAEQAGCIRVWEESAADGSPRNVVQVEVSLSPGAAEATPAPTATPGPVTPPSTGDAGLAAPDTGVATGAAAAAFALAMLLLVNSPRMTRGS